MCTRMPFTWATWSVPWQLRHALFVPVCGVCAAIFSSGPMLRAVRLRGSQHDVAAESRISNEVRTCVGLLVDFSIQFELFKRCKTGELLLEKDFVRKSKNLGIGHGSDKATDESLAKDEFQKADVDHSHGLQFNEFCNWHIKFKIARAQGRGGAASGTFARGDLRQHAEYPSLEPAPAIGEGGNDNGGASNTPGPRLTNETTALFAERRTPRTPVSLNRHNDASMRADPLRNDALVYGDLVYFEVTSCLQTKPANRDCAQRIPHFIHASFDMLTGNAEVLALPAEDITLAFSMGAVFEVVDPVADKRMGHAVLYEDRLRLRHTGSGKYLAIDIDTASEVAPEYSLIELSGQGEDPTGGAPSGRTTALVFTSCRKTKGVGSAVSGDDQLQLEFRCNNAPPQQCVVVQGSVPRAREVVGISTAAQSTFEMTLRVFEKFIHEDREKVLRIGDVVELFHLEAEGKLASVGAEEQLCLRQSTHGIRAAGMKTGRTKRHMFVVCNPSLERRARGGLLCPGDYFRLRDLSTGRYIAAGADSLGGGSNTCLGLALRSVQHRDVEESLFCISPHHRRKAGARGAHQIQEHCFLHMATSNRSETDRVCNKVLRHLKAKADREQQPKPRKEADYGFFNSKLLHSFDTDGDGHLLMEEFEAGIKSTGLQLKPVEWRLLRKHVHGGFMNVGGKPRAVVDVQTVMKHFATAESDDSTILPLEDSVRVLQLRGAMTNTGGGKTEYLQATIDQSSSSDGIFHAEETEEDTGIVKVHASYEDAPASSLDHDDAFQFQRPGQEKIEKFLKAMSARKNLDEFLTRLRVKTCNVFLCNEKEPGTKSDAKEQGTKSDAKEQDECYRTTIHTLIHLILFCRREDDVPHQAWLKDRKEDSEDYIWPPTMQEVEAEISARGYSLCLVHAMDADADDEINHK